jgi:uncharacterized protein YegP (UPF0339 family)
MSADSAYYERRHDTDGGHHLALVGANGETMMTTEGYSSEEHLERAIEDVVNATGQANQSPVRTKG